MISYLLQCTVDINIRVRLFQLISPNEKISIRVAVEIRSFSIVPIAFDKPNEYSCPILQKMLQIFPQNSSTGRSSVFMGN